MNALLYYPVYAFLWLLTLLPLRVLYLVSDFLFLLLFYIIRYRRKVAYLNLRRSFPDKTYGEIHRIAKQFYRQLTDYFIEWIYRIHISENEMARRLVFKNPEILTPYREEGRSIMLLLSHHGNWEWPVLIPKISGYKTLAVYKPLENKYFDRFFIRLRSLGGGVCVPVESTIREVIMHRKKEIPILVYTLADQRPRWRDLRHWTRFLEQDTPVIAGPEKTARKFNMVTVLLSLNKIKRGYYEAEFRVLNDNPSDADPYSIIRRYYGILEELIRSRPELYLWTHKRWKYRRQEAPNPPEEIGLPLSEEYGH